MNSEEHKEGVKYTCPMHLEVLRDMSGMCPECGMALIETQARVEHPHGHIKSGKHAGHSTEMFLRKFFVSLLLTIPVVVFSDFFSTLLGIHLPALDIGYWKWETLVSAVLGSAVFFYGGFVFLTGAWREIAGRAPGMMTLISVAISTAYLWSIYAVFFAPEQALFWELTTLITIMLLGHWLEMRAVSGAQGALRELSKLLPDVAEVMRGGTTHVVPLAEVHLGDVVLVKPGSKIPTDGKVVSGVSDVNESLATGESKPVSKKEGSAVIAGTINGDGALTIEVTHIGEETFLAGVMRLVAEAQSSKSHLQILSDRAAYYLTLIAIGGGLAPLVGWLVAPPGVLGLGFAVERMVAVLVVACPHALGLAVPLVASISTTKAAQNGFLVKQRLSLEIARSIDIVLFDKTGTLTKGEFGVDAVISNSTEGEMSVLQYAASVNSQSEHPIAHAVVAEAKKRNLTFFSIQNFKRLGGKGATADIRGATVSVGSVALLFEHSVALNLDAQKKIDQLSSQGKTIIFVIKEGTLLGAIALADVIRDESREAIESLHASGIKIAMVTGDSEDVAKWVAKELGIDEYFAKVLPGQKSEKVKILQSKGQKVAMVGDGVNDAPALAQADLGIAIGAGTNVAIESAGIILVRNDPRDISKIIKLSRLTYSKMIQNLFWATGYNIIAIPLAAGVLASKGFFLQPSLAAVFMSLSTIIVAVNAVLLRNRVL